jgi:hypothetical protein
VGVKKTTVPEEPSASHNNDASEAALELMKQLITLSSGVLALSATFIDKIGTASMYLLIVLGTSWIVLLGSLFFGLQTISSIVKSRLTKDNEWSKGYGRTSARLSKYAFVVGIALFAVFAFLSFATAKEEAQTSKPAANKFHQADSTSN